MEKQKNHNLDLSFEDIVPFVDGVGGDTGDSARLKLSRNFDKVVAAFAEILRWMNDNSAGDTKYLRKDQEDLTQYFMRFLGGASFGNFQTGLLGSGASIDKDGNVEARTITAWDSIRTPLFIFNKVDVVAGELWSAVAKGEIKSVDTAQKIIELKLEAGDYAGLMVDDYCRGIFNNITSQDNGSEDECGFLTEVGCSTSYFRITEILKNESGACSFKYELRTPDTFAPCAHMRFVVYANPTERDRQASAYFNRKYLRFMDKMDSWVIDADKNVYAQFGDLSGLTINNQQLSGYGSFLTNVYFKGVQIQLTDEQINQMTPYTVTLSADNFNIRLDANGSVVGSSSFISKIQVMKGSRKLTHGGIGGPGIYTTELVAVGCRAEVVEGVVTITNFINEQSSYTVTVKINCEQKVAFEKTINIQVVMDGQKGQDGVGQDGVSPLAMNLSNDTIVVLCDATGQAQGSGENNRIPPEFQPSTIVSMYQGTTHLMIDTIKVEFVEEGLYNKVSAYSEKITAGAPTGDIKLSITTLTAAAPDVCHLKLTASTKSKLSISSNVTIQKAHPSATTPIYQIVPSHEVIKVDKNGVYSTNKITAHVVEFLGDKVTNFSDALPGNLNIVCIRDGQNVSFTLANGVDVTNAKSSLVLELQKDNGSAPSIVLDRETVPVLMDGINGANGENGTGFIEIFKVSNEQPSAPTFKKEADITDDWSKQMPLLSKEVVSFSSENQWQLSTDGFYECPPVGNSQMGKEVLYFNFNEDVYVDVELQVNCEGNGYDFAFVGQLNARYNSIPNRTSGLLYLSGSDRIGHVSILVPAGMQNLSILYCKDSSNAPSDEYCRFRVIGVKRIWSSRSDMVFDEQANSWSFLGWSTPRLVNIINSEERIYILRSKQDALSAPFSDPNIDGYVPPLTAEQWSEVDTYDAGHEIAYNGSFYEALKTSTGILPTNTEYWKDIPTWTKTPSNVSEEFKYQFIAIRQQTNTVWQPWSTPAIFNAANEKGSQGVDGVSYLKITWAPGIDFLDGKTIVDGVYLQHIAMIRNKAIASGWEAYTCLVAHTSSTSFQADFDKGYWHKMAQNVADMYVNLMIAQNAIIDLFQGNQILIKKDDGTITLGLSGSEAGNKIRMWAGAQLPDKAPFTVDELGKMCAKKAKIEGDVTIGSLKMKVTPALADGSYQLLDKSSCIVHDGRYQLPILDADTFTEIKVYVSTSASRSVHTIRFRFPSGPNSLRIIHFGGMREYEAVNDLEVTHSGGVIRMRLVGIAETDGRQNWSVTYEGALNEQSFYIR